jgi:hypothetical protein
MGDGCFTKRQNQELLNPDGTLWCSSEIKPEFQRLVLRVQFTAPPSLLYSVTAKTLKDLMKSLCVLQLLQKEA